MTDPTDTPDLDRVVNDVAAGAAPCFRYKVHYPNGVHWSGAPQPWEDIITEIRRVFEEYSDDPAITVEIISVSPVSEVRT